MTNKQNASSTRRTLIAGGYTTLLAGFMLLCVVPFIHKTHSAQAEIQRLDGEIDQRQSQGKEVQELKLKVTSITEKTKDLPNLLPPDQDLGPFLTALVAQSDAVGLKDVSVRNLPPTTLGRSQKLPIEVHGRGSYAQFRDFLVRLEQLQRRASVGKMVVESDSDMNGNVEIQLTLFIYNSKPAQ